MLEELPCTSYASNLRVLQQDQKQGPRQPCFLKNKKAQKTQKLFGRMQIWLYILTSSLRKAFRKYTSIDLKTDEGQTLLAIHFITQAVPDI